MKFQLVYPELPAMLKVSGELGPYSWKILVLRVAPSNKILRKFLEMWVFPLKFKENILVKKKSNSESILTLKRGLKVRNCKEYGRGLLRGLRVSLAAEKMDETWRGRRNVLHTMHDSELIRRYTLDRAGIMFVTDLIRDMLTSLTLRRNAIAPEMDVITTLTYLATGKMQLCSSDDLGLLQHFQNLIVSLFISYKIRLSMTAR